MSHYVNSFGTTSFDDGNQVNTDYKTAYEDIRFQMNFLEQQELNSMNRIENLEKKNIEASLTEINTRLENIEKKYDAIVSGMKVLGNIAQRNREIAEKNEEKYNEDFRRLTLQCDEMIRLINTQNQLLARLKD
jgi:hypothetical protein